MYGTLHHTEQGQLPWSELHQINTPTLRTHIYVTKTSPAIQTFPGIQISIDGNLLLQILDWVNWIRGKYSTNWLKRATTVFYIWVCRYSIWWNMTEHLLCSCSYYLVGWRYIHCAKEKATLGAAPFAVVWIYAYIYRLGTLHIFALLSLAVSHWF